MNDREREMLMVLKDLLEICRIKCSPLDEITRPDGISNEQVMIGACNLIKRVEYEATKKPRKKPRTPTSFDLAGQILAQAAAYGRLSNAAITRRNGGVPHQFGDDVGAALAITDED